VVLVTLSPPVSTMGDRYPDYGASDTEDRGQVRRLLEAEDSRLHRGWTPDCMCVDCSARKPTSTAAERFSASVGNLTVHNLRQHEPERQADGTYAPEAFR